MSRKKFNKSNCVNQLRLATTDKLGNEIIVSGKYAYEWSLTIKNGNEITQLTFKCRKAALKELKRRILIKAVKQITNKNRVVCEDSTVCYIYQK